MATNKPITQRFEEKIYRCPMSGCWLWDGYVAPQNGYGLIAIGNRRMMRAHRFAWKLYRGPIPEGLWVLHRCDNPDCVRPDHLFLGTAKDNSQDMLRKGRSRNQFIGKLER